MPYKKPERQAAYLRKWREKRQRERLKIAKHVAKLVFSLYVSDNPAEDSEKVKQLLPLVFGRFLQPNEEEYLVGQFVSYPRRFLEGIIVLWRESYRRDVSPLEFVEDILLSPGWKTCPACGRPYKEDTSQDR